jgi:hypothetical protein
MGKVTSLMKTLEEQSRGLGKCFNEQNTFVENCLAKFLQTLDECPREKNSPIPWSSTLDDYKQRIKALEEKVCKCVETKPWVHGSGTQRDPLKLMDEELKYADKPAPPSLSSGYGTPDVSQPELIDERRGDREGLPVVVPSCCAQPSPNLGTQVRGYVARFIALANLLSLDAD